MDRRGGLVARVYLHRRFAILFYSLLLTLVAAPTSGALGVDAGLLELFLAANLLIAMASVGGERSRWALLLIVLILWAARAATLWLGHPLVALIGLGIWTLLGLFAAGAALRFAMRTRSVGGEHIYAALSAYLLVGILFGFLYWILQQAWPASFAIADGLSRMSAIYFSFITLDTLGYGDIAPRSDIARGLAMLEGVGGQLFLAVLIARLVSAYRQSDGEP